MPVRLVLAVVLLVLSAGCGGGDDSARGPGGTAIPPPRHATLALDFAPNAAHAGIYMAVGDRHDRRHGVALRVRVPSASSDSLKLLNSGRADLAIVDIHDLGLAREAGQDLVGVGAIVQRPLAAVIAHARVRRPRDLEGRRVGVTGLPSDEAVVRAVVGAGGGDPRRVRRVTIGFSAVPSLLTGRVDAATAFWNAEGVALRQRGVRTREFRVEEFGAPRYPELVLAVRRETLERDPSLVDAVVAALTAGTQAALRNPGSAARRIVDASGTEAGLVRAQLAAVRPALRPALRLDPDALRGWGAFDARFGILKRRPDLARAFRLPRF